MKRGTPAKPTARRGKRDGADKLPWSGSVWWLLAMVVILWLWQELFQGIAVETIPYSRFKQHLAQGEVVEVVIQPEVVEGKIEPSESEVAATEAQSESPAPFLFRSIRVEDPKLIEQLEAAEVQFVGKRERFITQFLWAWVLPIGIMLLLWGLIMRRVGAAAGQAIGFGKSRAKLVADKDTGVTFVDVAGCEEAKLELREVVDFLCNPQRYEQLGAKIPKGVLLVGPPGTGKTLLARAVAGEAKVPFFALSGSDFVEMFAGVGAARVRDLFEQAVAHAPCIIFIDELDAIGRQRGVHMGVVNDEREQTLNQLLVELDGFEANKGVILLAATNRPDVLDTALLRPGRFDRQVVLDAPDLEGRMAIMAVHMRNKPTEPDVDLRNIAQQTPGFSGADLANTINEAALLAARRGATKIAQADCEEAVEKIVAGPERKSKRLSEEDKRRVAYHEAGHALVAFRCPKADPVHKITIVPRGHAALGYTLQLPHEDQVLATETELLDKLTSMLGGRAAEEVVFAEISSGAENDLERATALARQMVALLGMSQKIGLARVGQREGSPFLLGPNAQLLRDCSEQTAREVDEEVRRLLEECYARAKAILQQDRGILDQLSAALLERETLDRSGFLAIVARTGELEPPANQVSVR